MLHTRFAYDTVQRSTVDCYMRPFNTVQRSTVDRSMRPFNDRPLYAMRTSRHRLRRRPFNDRLLHTTVQRSTVTCDAYVSHRSTIDRRLRCQFTIDIDCNPYVTVHSRHRLRCHRSRSTSTAIRTLPFTVDIECAATVHDRHRLQSVRYSLQSTSTASPPLTIDIDCNTYVSTRNSHFS